MQHCMETRGGSVRISPLLGRSSRKEWGELPPLWTTAERRNRFVPYLRRADPWSDADDDQWGEEDPVYSSGMALRPGGWRVDLEYLDLPVKGSVTCAMVERFV